MNNQASKILRIHALDSLRAIMMLLGLVLHAATPYFAMDLGFIKDPNSSNFFFDLLAHFIHAFRMPTFFVVAGFFGAMLYYERGARKMLSNRCKRILYPFLVFLILLYPTFVFSWNYAFEIVEGNPNAAQDVLTYISDPINLIPIDTWHLWFLYYLMLFTLAAAGLSSLFKKQTSFTSAFRKKFEFIIQYPILRILVFALFSFLIFLLIEDAIFIHSTSIVPDYITFLYFFIFYLVGWALYKSKHLLDSLKKMDRFSTVLGVLLFGCSLFLQIQIFESEDNKLGGILMLVSSLMLWCFVFGITGLFIRYAGKFSARMRYVSDASYWVYLVHYTLTLIIPALLFQWEESAGLKFIIVILSTTIFSFVTYHFLVRGTFIGKFLNGRKYSRKLGDIPRD